MTELKRLGDAESQALAALKRRGGTWTVGEPPLWDGSAHWTLRLMASLSRKGYVVVTGVEAFELSPEALAADSRNPSR